MTRVSKYRSLAICEFDHAAHRRIAFSNSNLPSSLSPILMLATAALSLPWGD